MAKQQSPSLLEFLNFEDTQPRKKKKGNFTSSSSRRNTSYEQGLDFVETPSIATEALLSVEKFRGNILEPCAGRGAISSILIEHGYDVISRDLVDREKKRVPIDADKNYFHSNEMFDNVVTNPPFRFASQFAYHAIQHVRYKVAILCRGGFLETKPRKNFLFDNPDIPTCFEKLYVFSERLPFGKENMVMYCWFIWNKEFKGIPTVHWL